MWAQQIQKEHPTFEGKVEHEQERTHSHRRVSRRRGCGHGGLGSWEDQDMSNSLRWSRTNWKQLWWSGLDATDVPGHRFGLVILVPKKAFVNAPEQFRPIVCGEAMLKLLAKLAMTRIALQWPVPNCCFGACRGRGVPEALYTVKLCAQEAAGLQDDTIFLQLDVSSPLIPSNVLRFQLFGNTWSPPARRYSTRRISLS